MKSMNLSQGNEIFVAVALSACFAQLEEEDDVPAPAPAEFDVFGHRKKFLEPNPISFSSLSKPGTGKISVRRENQRFRFSDEVD